MQLPMCAGCASLRIDAHHQHIIPKMIYIFLPINYHFDSVFFLKNIARGTTDPGYWAHNSNHHPWQISFWRWNDIHIWLKEPGSESKAWIIFEADHLSHLVHLPVVLLGPHHLNDNHHLPNGPTTYIVTNMITAPIFPATLAPPCRPPWWPHSPHWTSPYKLTTPPPS